MTSIANIIAWTFFGLVGFAAFLYGKRQGYWKTMAVAAALMVYPYFVTNPIAIWVVGLGLTGSLFVLRE
jgi:hypothetical protein